MAFTGLVLWEVESGGDDTNNGGGFDSGVAGFPTDGAATSATGNSPVFTSASYNFVAGDVGAFVFIKSGTNWTPGFYKITSVSANAATLSAAVSGAVIYSAVINGPAPTGLNTVAGCATTASPTGATWGIDYSQQAVAQFSSSTFAIDGTTNTKLTDGTNTIGKNWVGNIIAITSGTGFTVQRVAVVSTSGTAATVDKSLGTLGSTSGVGKLGGALASPGIAGSLMGTLQACFILNATYSFTTNTGNVAGGPMAAAPTANCGLVCGYSLGNRFFGNTGTQPIFQNNGSTISTFAGGLLYCNITGDGNGQTAARAVASTVVLLYCTLKNYNTASASVPVFIGCLATANSASVFTGQAVYCEAYGNTSTPFLSLASPFYKCLSYSNTGATTDGFTFNGNYGVVCDCTAYANGRDGFRNGNQQFTYINCYAEGNTGSGFTNATRGMLLINCGAYNNTGGNFGGSLWTLQGPLIAPTASAFVSATDLSLNNLANAGALLRAQGYAGYVKNFMPRGLTATYGDVGVAQHADPIAVRYQSNMLGGLDG